MQSLPMYAHLLCNQVGLEFTMGGEDAWSAGGRINLPALPYNEPSVGKLAYGLIMHEGGHESHTDFQEWDAIKKDKAMSNMVNRLEDIRIERKQIDRFPGAKSRLQDMTAGLVDRGFWSAPQDADSPATLLGKTILYRLRASALSQSVFEAWGEESFKKLGEVIPPHLASHLMTIAEQVIWCQNTRQVVDLAANILALLKEEQDKLEEPPKADPVQKPQQGPQNQGNQQGQPQAGPSQGDPSQVDPSSGQQPGQGAQGGQPEQGNTPAQGSPEGNSQPQGGSAAGEPDPQKKAQAQAISQILSGENDTASGDVGQAVCDVLSGFSRTGDKNIAMPVAQKSTLEVGETSEILGKIQGASRALQTRAHRLFEASAKKRRAFREEGRRVDPSRLWKPKTGDYRVFVEKLQAPRVNTAIEVLVDISNSMNSSQRLEPAINTALALALALSKLNGVKVATATFPATGSSTAKEGEQVSVIHGFDQRPELAAKRYAGMWSHAFTPTAEALLWAGRELMSRKENRKIVFVLTDGYPEMPDRQSKAYRGLTVDVRESLEEAGIEVVGIGIGINISEIFPKSVQVNNPDELASSVFSLISKTLLKAA